MNYKDGTFISVLDATEISREWFVVLFQMEVNLFHKFASLKSNQIMMTTALSSVISQLPNAGGNW